MKIFCLHALAMFALVATACSTKTSSSAGSAAGPQCEAPRTHSPGGGSLSDEIRPPPPSIGTDIPATYFGPPPSEVQRELIGPHQLLKAGRLDVDAGTITLPLYHGQMEATGAKVWYILTDTTDERNADALGLNFSAKLNYSFIPGRRSARTAMLEADGTLTFQQGTVDFSPERRLVRGQPNAFPPSEAQAGSVGDRFCGQGRQRGWSRLQRTHRGVWCRSQ